MEIEKLLNGESLQTRDQESRLFSRPLPVGALLLRNYRLRNPSRKNKKIKKEQLSVLKRRHKQEESEQEIIKKKKMYFQMVQKQKVIGDEIPLSKATHIFQLKSDHYGPATVCMFLSPKVNVFLSL